jgi:hypothetical protein
MTQKVLDFELSSSDELLTPRAGTIIFGEYLKGLGLESLCNTNLPLPLAHNGYEPFKYIYPLVLMLHSGGRVCEDIRSINYDKALKKILKIDCVPDPTSITKWMKRIGVQGIIGIENINKTLIKRYVKNIKEGLVLDIDATFIASGKNTAQYSYKKETGYMPMIGHINGGYTLCSEFRDGNISPADTNLEFIKKCSNKLPNNKQMDIVRADSATYQADVFNWCDDHNVVFTIGGQLDSSTMTLINQIKEDEFKPLFDSKTQKVADVIHTMKKTNNAFRLIVVKKEFCTMLPILEDVLTHEEKQKYYQERYSVIATNDNETSAEDIVKFYRQRGETSENKIKELKNGFNLDYLPTSDFISNAFYFQIGTLAYNLFILFKQILDKNLQKHTIKTIRYKIYGVAGKVITHARKVVLKINSEFLSLFQTLRARAYEVSLQ